MTDLMRQRMILALVGAAAGASLYALGEVLDGDLIGDRLALAMAALTGSFFFGLLAMTGPLPIHRAARGALIVAVVLAALLTWAGLRFDTIDELGNSPFPATAVAILMWIPLPFLIAAEGPGWRDYACLFAQAWGIFVRYSVAWIFVAVVWGVILLSDALFGVVGLTVIDDLLEVDIVPWLITGTVLGLALAVVQELADVLSPYLVLRLLRLLVPAVLVVMAVFILALPFRGFSGLFGGLSVAATLLGMVGAAATLITSAVDQDDAGATENPLMRRATQALAVLLPVPAVMAAIAIGIRVDQYGWTPDRLYAATAAAVGLGYGCIYALAVLRGAGWMDRIRSGNTAMAGALVVGAVLWLGPFLSPEAISARNQVARAADGRTPVAALDLYALDRMGRAGAAARQTLTDLAKEPGREELGIALANPSPGVPMPEGEDPAALRAELTALLPLQPTTATATRDMLLAAADAYVLRNWVNSCKRTLPQGGPACVMVVTDLLPSEPGEEAAIISMDAEYSYARFEALSLRGGLLHNAGMWSTDGRTMPEGDQARAFIAALQKAPPALSQAPLNQIATPDGLGLAPYP
ncbi:MAG: DUF4153 domain-containing protein [Paracoccaceae bacterium]